MADTEVKPETEKTKAETPEKKEKKTSISEAKEKVEVSEEAKKAAPEEAKKAVSEEANKAASEAAKKAVSEEANKVASEAAKKAAAEEAKKAAAEEAKKAAAEEAKKAAAEEAKKAAAEEAKKAEEAWDKKLKEIQASIQRFAPHCVPDREQQSKVNYAWHLRIYPIDQEDCRNCILEAATKLAQKTLYHVPRRRNGYGTAELYMASDKDALNVMGRVVRTTFFHRYVTVELTCSSKTGKGSAKKPEETATIVLDTTKCEKIRNTVVSKEGPNSLWVRYLSENTSPEFLHVLFPLSTSAQVQTHDGLHFGLVEANSKADLLVFMKAYQTVIINGTNVLSLHTKEPGEKESAMKAEIEKMVQALGEPKLAPTEPTDKYTQRRDDKNETARILKRTLHQQHGLDQAPPSKRSRVEPLVQRGMSGNINWGGVAQFSGAVGGHGGFGAQLNPRGITEMVMMQARLNQLMMLNPGARRGFNTGFGGGRFGGSGGVRGGQNTGNLGFNGSRKRKY